MIKSHKPVLVLQHQSSDGPAYLGTWLRAHAVEHEVRVAGEGTRWPADMGGYAAMALLGGEMSANDDLPMLRDGERLIVQAIERGLPVIGHCLGGQLMARALGAKVHASPAPEIGWQPLQVFDGEESRAWFGDLRQAQVMQWHYESFDLPPGAKLLASSAACPHQAFAIGPHLAMQFHIEADAEKIDRWSHEVGQNYRDALKRHPTSVQSGADIRASTGRHIAAQQALADRIYGRWLSGL